MFRVKSSSGMSVAVLQAQDALIIYQKFIEDGDADVQIVDALDKPVLLDVLLSLQQGSSD